MLYKKIKQCIVALAISTSITSIAQAADSQLKAETVKTKSGSQTTYTNVDGKVMKSVKVKVKGNITITVTTVYDVNGKKLSKETVAVLRTEGEDPTVVRKETKTENSDGSTSHEVTNNSTDPNGVTTSRTSRTTTNKDGSGASTATVTTTQKDGSSTTSTTGTTTTKEGVTTATKPSKSSRSDLAIDIVKDENPGQAHTEGGDAGSYNPTNNYKNTPTN